MLQNEISGLEKILRDATHRDLRVVFNAAPMTADVLDYPLGGVEFFVINETEGAALTGSEDPEDIIDAILARYPGSSVILTLGKSGVIYGDIDQRVRQVAFEVEAVDATGAGDTFTGYFLAGLAADLSIEASLEAACRAAAHCVTRSGAASSIPTRGEINQARFRCPVDFPAGVDTPTSSHCPKPSLQVWFLNEHGFPETPD
ncbi:MAG: PfkB family carbohydrate kinase [Gammaproteobacteria bacterium]|nr:PfkB family carbohydrate kinase [Gammaproteobacteria bacterium]